MPDVTARTTRNPFRHAYAYARYDVGLALEKVLYRHQERFPRLYRWAYAAEAAQNCAIDPWLGKASRLEAIQRRHAHRAHDLALRIGDTPEGPIKQKLVARRERALRRAWKACVDLAYHRLLIHPDDFDAQWTVRMHERVPGARA